MCVKAKWEVSSILLRLAGGAAIDSAEILRRELDLPNLQNLQCNACQCKICSPRGEIYDIPFACHYDTFESQHHLYCKECWCCKASDLVPEQQTVWFRSVDGWRQGIVECIWRDRVPTLPMTWYRVHSGEVGERPMWLQRCEIVEPPPPAPTAADVHCSFARRNRRRQFRRRWDFSLVHP